MTNLLDITFDLETTALTPNAAVMSIGAVAWDRNCDNNNPFWLTKFDKQKNKYDENHQGYCKFQQYVDMRTMFVNGFDFDPNTAYWWSKQKQEAKDVVCSNPELSNSIENVLTVFFEWIKNVCNDYGFDDFNLWTQGTDFDIAILRNIVSKLFKGKKFPVNHCRFRDARTYILEGGEQIAHICDPDKEVPQLMVEDLNDNPNKVYDIFPDIPSGTLNDLNAVAHSSIYDAIRSSWNVWCVMQFLRHRLSPDEYPLYQRLKGTDTNH